MTAPGEPLRVVIVRDGRHPLVLLVLVACVLAAATGLFGPGNPRSVIDQFVPEPWRTGYYVILGAAGLLTMVGVWLRHPRDRLMVEQIGLWFLSGVLLVYPLAIYALYSGTLGLGGVMSCLLGVGGLWRIADIALQLRRWPKPGAQE